MPIGSGSIAAIIQPNLKLRQPQDPRFENMSLTREIGIFYGWEVSDVSNVSESISENGIRDQWTYDLSGNYDLRECKGSILHMSFLQNGYTYRLESHQYYKYIEMNED